MAVDISKVNFTYYPNRKKEKNRYVLKDLNLHVDNTGEIICIVGHTGSGKSTLMQLMNALIFPTEGEVKVDDIVIKSKNNKNLKYVRKKIGLVFQFPEYQLFEETVLKDVAFGPKNFGLDNPIERAKDALKLFGLDEKYYERNPYHCSGGQMRKFAIAGILASSPEVLILDEPTVGLDPLAKSEFVKMLKDIHNKENKTIIIVTHDMDVLWSIAKRVIVLDSEQIVFDGSKYDLFKDEEFVLKHSLDLPDIIKVCKEVKEKLNIPIDIYQDTVEDAYLEIKRCLDEQ